MNKAWIFFLFLTISPSLTQTSRANKLVYGLNNYSHHLAQCFGASFDEPGWLAAAGGIAAASRFDDDFRQICRKTCLPGPLARFGDYYGMGLNYLLASGYIFADGMAFQNRPKKETLKNWRTCSEAFAATTALTFAIKVISKRRRPDSSDRFSFPSGHTSTSFSIAASLNGLYGYRVAIPFILSAVITGVERIHDDRHWLSDVLAGALLGILIGDGFAAARDEPRESKGGQLLFIQLTFRL